MIEIIRTTNKNSRNLNLWYQNQLRKFKEENRRNKKLNRSTIIYMWLFRNTINIRKITWKLFTRYIIINQILILKSKAINRIKLKHTNHLNTQNLLAIYHFLVIRHTEFTFPLIILILKAIFSDKRDYLNY